LCARASTRTRCRWRSHHSMPGVPMFSIRHVSSCVPFPLTPSSPEMRTAVRFLVCVPDLCPLTKCAANEAGSATNDMPSHVIDYIPQRKLTEETPWNKEQSPSKRPQRVQVVGCMRFRKIRGLRGVASYTILEGHSKTTD